MIQEVRQQPPQVLAMLRKIVEFSQRPLRFAREQSASERKNLALSGKPEHGEDVFFDDLAAAKADQLVQSALRVAHPAVGAPGDGMKSCVVDFDLLQFGDLAKMLNDERHRNATQIKALATRKDGGKHLFRLGGGKHELYMSRGLFQRLEKRIEGFFGEHVNFVNDVDLKPRTGRRVFGGFAQLTDFIDTAIARAVDFENIERTSFGDFLAARVVVVEIDFGAAGAIEAFGEDARDGGLARAARPAKQIGMGDPALLDGV